MKKAVIAVGTNIGDRKKYINDAVDALNHLPGTKVDAISNIYETEPWGYTEQPNFYNGCILVETELSPSALLGACLGIEAAFGRERPFKNAPRVIDLDLLLYENYTSDTPELRLPHPGIAERNFVLFPLKDILKNLKWDKFDYSQAFEKIKDDIIDTV